MGLKIIIFIVVAVFLLGGIVYLYNSGSFNGHPGSNSTSSGTSFFQSLFGRSSGSVSFPNSNPNGSFTPTPTYSLGPRPGNGTIIYQGSTSSPNISPYEIPSGYTLAQLSPYFHEVRFGGVSHGYGTYAGQVSFSASPPQGQTIDVTGWQIKSNYGGAFIPTAINIYDPSGLAAPSDIRMKAGDTLNLYSTQGPFNLRLNECIGYIGVTNQMNPPLPQNCPYTDRGAIQNLTGACQNFILSIPTCQQPNFNSPSIPQNDYACISYLSNHFTYKSCYDEHQADPNFLSNEIRAWIGSNVADPYHDTVKLLDQSGLLVDVYNY